MSTKVESLRYEQLSPRGTVRFTERVAVVVAAGVDVSVAGAAVVVSVAGGDVSGVGWTVVAGAVVVGWASCAKAGVEKSASAAAIAGRARVGASSLVVVIMTTQPAQRTAGRIVIG